MRAKSLCAATAALVAGLIFVTGGEAATTTTVKLTVNSTADSSTPCTITANHKSAGTCTLRGAILAANAFGQDNTVFVVKLSAKTYHLSLGTLDVSAFTDTGNLVQIVGATARMKKTPASIVDGSANPKPASVFEVDSPTQMLNLVVTGGSGNPNFSCGGANGCGGGIVLTSALDLQNSIVRNNKACSAWTGKTCTGPYGYGGGIYMPYAFRHEVLTLSKTTVTHNTAAGGGGIENDDTSHSVILALQSHIDRNTACATFSHGVCVDYGFGGGLANQGGQVTLEYSTVNGNVAGSPAYGSGNGGGIYQNYGNMQLDHTTVNGNVAAYQGGGVYDTANVDFVDSTVSQNVSGAQGGGVYSDLDVSFDRTTVSSNTAGGTFACTIGATASCAQTVGKTAGDCATLYPSATSCTSSPGFGGGIMSDFSSNAELLSSTITKNLAASLAGSAPDCSGGQGGGVFSAWAFTALAGTHFTRNVADCGGGIYDYHDARHGHGETYAFALSDSTIAGNTALEDGGGIWTEGTATGTLYGTKVTGNHAGRTTGGVWDDEVGSVLIGVGSSVSANVSPDTCKNITWPCR
ncbi:MAG TPA: CSLREA domain-containing protein [Gaiellaceae bacterium]|jgi:CSLREA domain-containing protein